MSLSVPWRLASVVTILRRSRLHCRLPSWRAEISWVGAVVRAHRSQYFGMSYATVVDAAGMEGRLTSVDARTREEIEEREEQDDEARHVGR